MLGVEFDRLEILLDRQIHIHYVGGCDLHDQIRVDLICRNAVTDVVGADDGVAHAAQDSLEREAVAWCFAVGADGIVGYKDIPLELAVSR